MFNARIPICEFDNHPPRLIEFSVFQGSTIASDRPLGQLAVYRAAAMKITTVAGLCHRIVPKGRFVAINESLQTWRTKTLDMSTPHTGYRQQISSDFATTSTRVSSPYNLPLAMPLLGIVEDIQ